MHIFVYTNKHCILYYVIIIDDFCFLLLRVCSFIRFFCCILLHHHVNNVNFDTWKIQIELTAAKRKYAYGVSWTYNSTKNSSKNIFSDFLILYSFYFIFILYQPLHPTCLLLHFNPLSLSHSLSQFSYGSLNMKCSKCASFLFI